MSPDTDDDLGIDLHAWQPPDPPATLVDDVIARMREAPVAPRAKRRWLVPAVAATLAAAAAIAVIATRPQDIASAPAGSVHPPAGGAGGSGSSVAKTIAGSAAPIDPPSTVPTCADRIAGAKTLYADGKFARALAAFEATLSCDHSSASYARAALASCASRDATKARKYVLLVDAGERAPIVQRCLAEGIQALPPDPTPAKPAEPTRTLPAKTDCDSKGRTRLEQQGREAFGASQDSVALQAFDTLLACRWADNIGAMATISACRLGLDAKAKTLFAKLSPTRRQQVETRCLALKVPLR